MVGAGREVLGGWVGKLFIVGKCLQNFSRFFRGRKGLVGSEVCIIPIRI